MQRNCFRYQNRRFYLGINTKNVALYFIHGVEAVGHGAQMEPFENHLVLGESSCNTRQMSDPAHLLGLLGTRGTAVVLRALTMSYAGFSTALLGRGLQYLCALSRIELLFFRKWHPGFPWGK